MTYPNNKSFCAAPWVHLHLLPDGKAMPCCFWDAQWKRDDYGNINDYDSVEDLMNHPNFKELRKQFLSGERHHGCHRCYQHEDEGRPRNSMRTWFNETFISEKSYSSVANTTDDGTIDPNIVYLDIRYGNICNLKCRMCGYELSSTWHDELITLHDQNGKSRSNPDHQINKPKFIHVDAYDKIEPYLNYVEEIYFAGGEPTLYPEHLKMLDKLLELGRTDVKLKYNTNLSSLSYKGRDLVEVWSKFDKVSIGASIDAMQDTVEYIRTNLNWNKFEQNFDRIANGTNAINIFPAPTIGVLNLEVFPEFNRFCIEKGWTKHTALVPNFVTWPKWQHPGMLPDWYRDEIIKKYEEHIAWLEDHENNGIGYLGKNQVQGIQSIIGFIRENRFEEDRREYLISELWKRLWVFDKSANLTWHQSLPHLWNFFQRYKDKKGWTRWPD